MRKKDKKPKRTGVFSEPAARESKKKERQNIKGLSTFFVLGSTLQGTTPALIKAKNFKQAHWIYTHAVLIPAKRKAKDLYQPKCLKEKKNIYYDGEIYIERLKIWKWVKGYPISAVDVRLKFNFVMAGEPKID